MGITVRFGNLCLRRSIWTSVKNHAKGTVIKTAIIPEPAPVRDTTALQKYCCGLNFRQTGNDPEIKEEHEYPNWLWTIHTGRPKVYKDFSISSKDYWLTMRNAQRMYNDQITKNKTFFVARPEHEIRFYSRFPDENDQNVQSSS